MQLVRYNKFFQSKCKATENYTSFECSLFFAILDILIAMIKVVIVELWATQYCDDCVIVEPKESAQRVQQRLQSGLEYLKNNKCALLLIIE